MTAPTVTDDELTAAVRYMRADEICEESEAERELIRELMIAAKIYLANAGVERPGSGAQLYDLALHSLTLYYYDHRDAVGTEAEIPRGLRPIITQLKLHAAVLAGT